MFNWFSLDFIYYPVSGIMWVWYKIFSFLIGLIPGVYGPSNFFSWALAVVFLVFTLRAILYRPFVRQIRTTRQMQELQPQIKALQKKYGKDRQRLALEMQKLQREHGFNPILGCLPMLAQIPVFLGLFHVLRSFNRTGGYGIGAQNLPVDVNRELPNYFFSAEDVGHFLDAHLFGAPIGAWITQSEASTEAFTEFNRATVAAVAIPIMLAAGIATYFNSRASISRQSPEAAANPQTALMNKLALYVFPMGVIVGGPFLPIAILIYWFSNNIWTFGQQHYVFAMIEREEEEKKRQQLERRATNAPPPGAKPAKARKGGQTGSAKSTERGDESTDAEKDSGATTEVQEPAGDSAAATEPRASGPSGTQKASGKSGSGPGRTPRPGARPKKRKR